MLNSYFVCFIIYIFFFNFEIFFVDIIFVPKIGVCFSFYPVSLIFEYEAKPHIRWPHIREYEAGESGANFTSVSSRWSQRFSQGLGFARLDSVSLLFASYIDDFSSLQYRYVRGWNMGYKCFHLFMDSQPDFYFICPTNPPASLCASRPTFSSEDLFTSVSETCMHHGAIRCCYLISLRTKMNRGVSSWNISVGFDYNIKSIVTDVEPMLGRRRRATSTQRRNDVGSTSHGRYRPNVGPTHVPL